MIGYDSMKKWLFLTLILVLPGCATIKLGSIPPPQDTTQLRVVVYPVSGAVQRGDWGKSTHEFRNATYRQMSRVLSRFGAYQVVSQQEVHAVLGEQDPAAWQLSGSNWELAFELGRALHADYVMVVERGTLGEPHYYFATTLLNVATGAKYAVHINHTREQVPRAHRLPPGTGQEAYRELFRDAKADLLATALRKGRRMMRGEAVDYKREEEARRKLEDLRAVEQKALEAAEQSRRVQERALAEKAAAERVLLKRAEQERKAAEALARVKMLEVQKRQVEEKARRDAEQARIVAERQAMEKAEAVRRAAQQAAREKAEAQRMAVLKVEQERKLAAESERVRKAEEQRRQSEDASRRELERAKIAAKKSFGLAPRQVQYKDAEKKEGVVNGRKKLIIYDIASPEALHVAALILSEALREEILSRGNFKIVNRENLSQIGQEIKFQQSGLVDPAQAVKLGKGAGANEVVTSNLGTLGHILMLQSKRIEVETMLNISAASLKGRPGQEDTLLELLPGLVDRLFAPKQ